jgi:hypothetical protein
VLKPVAFYFSSTFGGAGGIPPFTAIAYAMTMNKIPAINAKFRGPWLTTNGRAILYIAKRDTRDPAIKNVKINSLVFGGEGGIPPFKLAFFVSVIVMDLSEDLCCETYQ